MSRKRHSPNPAPGQLTLNFFVLPESPSTEAQPERGDNPLDALVRQALGEMMAGLDRDALAAKVSGLLGREVRRDMLDQWCAPSQAGRRPHADALIALMIASDSVRALELIADRLGYRVLTEQEAMLAEYGAAVSVEQEIVANRKALAAKLQQTAMGAQMLTKWKASK